VDKAVEEYKTAIYINGDHLNSHLNLGWIYRDKKQLDAAFDNFNRAIKLDPQSNSAFYGLGTILYEQGVLDKAI
jgi:tetratricopeptide (TPR) repeat protein